MSLMFIGDLFAERFYLTACSLFAASMIPRRRISTALQPHLTSFERLVTRAKDQRQGQKGKRLTLPYNDVSLYPSLPASLCWPFVVYMRSDRIDNAHTVFCTPHRHREDRR